MSEFWPCLILARTLLYGLLTKRRCRANFDIRKGPVNIEWFIGAQTNICYNAVDRHIAAGQANRVAFFWEGNDRAHTRTITYRQLQSSVCKIANYLKGKGVDKGHNVTIYMPMIPELPAAMVPSLITPLPAGCTVLVKIERMCEYDQDHTHQKKNQQALNLLTFANWMQLKQEFIFIVAPVTRVSCTQS